MKKRNKKILKVYLIGLLSALILDVSFYYLAYNAYIDYKEGILMFCFGISMGITFVYAGKVYKLLKNK
ncbi:MAG: hypothetical protein IJ966_02030 [Bacilli bacterium]|nr:hypothetical protein [Bacilli bacterium]